MEYIQEMITIAGGNLTALIWDVPENEKYTVSQNALKTAEQVGFLTNNGKDTIRMCMMGNELSINGTIATASLCRNETLMVSGIEGPIAYKNYREKTSITVPLPYLMDGITVRFQSIGYSVIENRIPGNKWFYRNMCNTYGLPAFGTVTYRKDKIYPTVYVKDTDSLVSETACGSGSLAFYLRTGISEVIQPTGQIISVKLVDTNTFSITACISRKGGDIYE